MKKLYLTLSMLFVLVGMAMAQRTVVGTILGDDGEALIGASVRVKGANAGTVTDVNGKFSVAVPKGSETLVVSYTGFKAQEIALSASNVLDVTLATDNVLQDVVVTALGVSRYKNELAFSAQKVEGEDLSNTRNTNVVNSLSGKVAGLEIRSNNTLGGSSNIILRGNKSLTGNNQALFVVDNVPVSNATTNTDDQKRGRLGYDYGNAASDINPDDIESVTVLKGAAASALYGSRAANGVILITTKKGSKKKGLGVTVNAGMNFGSVDKSTFVKYQNEYGAGYGSGYPDPSGHFFYGDANGDEVDDLVTPLTEDASWGAKFDPTLQVYQWDSFDPSSPNYQKSRPWVAATNDPTTFFQNALGTSNGISLDGNSTAGFFKLGYTKTTDKGILPNSRINKDLFNFGAGFKLTEKFTVFSTANFTSTDGLGRYGTGYDSKNLMTNFRQWWQTNVDIKEQEDAYNRNKENITWNMSDIGDLSPIYWDNPYWTRYENYQSDHRNRYFGNVGGTYKISSWLNATGRVSLDQYDQIQEERIAKTSVDVSEYRRYNLNYKENNIDLLLETPQREITDKIKFDALVGGNLRSYGTSSILAKTNGGLNIARLYSLTNSKNALEAPSEVLSLGKTRSIFAKVGFVYDGFAILDISHRIDNSSTLPTGTNVYNYPAISTGLIFSHFLGENSGITFGKIRANYAAVGNDTDPNNVFDTYTLNTGYNGNLSAGSPLTRKNLNLKSERTKSIEGGLEMRFWQDKIGFDLTVYKSNSVDQIFPADISRASGADRAYINAGDVQNIGTEISAFIRPFTSKNWNWRMDVNWARNRSKVVSLAEGVTNLILGAGGFQGGITINAAVGEPYGVIKGTDFVYKDGQKVVGDDGHYIKTGTTTNILGNANPDWIGGVFNTISYKNISLGFLIDVRMGGDLWTLDQSYGLSTGVAESTVGKNDLGNDIRSVVTNDNTSGGLILPGVLEDGTKNNIRADFSEFGGFGYAVNPNAAFIYDASFVKLREVNLNYNLGKSFLGSKLFEGGSIGVYGRNLWIIHKNLPYADPEDGLSAGNVQGYQVGSYPTTRIMGVNLKLKF
jgi:TonB-linked SusC/RagA family outer membrane protein